MLTPEQVQSARSQFNITPVQPQSSMTRSQEFQAAVGTSAAPTAPSPLSSVTSGIGDTVNAIGKDTQNHAANIVQDLSEKPSLTGATDVLGNVAGEVGDFFGEPLKAITSSAYNSEDTNGILHGIVGAVKSIAGTPAAQGVISAWNAFQSQHPDAAKNIGNAVNIGALFGGGVAEDAAKPILNDSIQSLKEGGANVVQGAKDVVPQVREAIGNVKGVTKDLSTKVLGSSEDNETTKVWNVVKPELTKSEQAQAVTEGKIISTGPLKTIKQIPKGRDLQMIEAARPYVASAQNPIEAVSNMQKGIADEATKLRAGLDDTGAIYSKPQIKGALDKLEVPTMIASDATLNNAYSLVKNKMLDLVGTGGKLGDLLGARQKFDAFVNKQFPNLYSSENLTPMRSAIRDIRGALNDTIDSRLPEGKLPDGTNFKDSLRKQSLLYDAIDNASLKTPKVGSNIVTRAEQTIKKHPIITTIGAGAGAYQVAKTLGL